MSRVAWGGLSVMEEGVEVEMLSYRYYVMSYSTLSYSIVLYSIVLYSIVLYSIV